MFWRDRAAFEHFVEVDGTDPTKCRAKEEGTVLTNPAYAETLELLASAVTAPIVHREVCA